MKVTKSTMVSLARIVSFEAVRLEAWPRGVSQVQKFNGARACPPEDRLGSRSEGVLTCLN